MEQKLQYKPCLPAHAGLQVKIADQEFNGQFADTERVSLLTLVPATHHDMLSKMAFVGIDFPNGETRLIQPRSIATVEDREGTNKQGDWKWARVPSTSKATVYENQLVGLPAVSGG